MRLDRRSLNRATLERQLLLCRSSLPAVDAVSRLAGIQAQIPNAPYVGLWSRLTGFKPDDLVQPLLRKQVVRIALMRSTVHLVTAKDAAALRPLVQPALDRDLFKNGTYGPGVSGLPVAETTACARKLLADQPLTAQELGQLLHERWPDRPAEALAYAMRNLLPLVQLPPRGIWGVGGLTRYAVADDWLGRQESVALTLEDMVLRYLAAFGPATVQDMQMWSGLSRLGSVVERLKPRLRAYRDEAGRTLYDLEEAVLPPVDAPAPPRFLPEYDNLLFGFADRSRIVREDDRKLLFRRNVVIRPVLSDGFICGTWKVIRKRSAAALMIATFEKLPAAKREELAAEGESLLRFAAENTRYEISFEMAE
ncbi:winged helix DNA-binding domain-containing protein [Paenibacillus antri]|uniref:Winged helix DNA-binding domain-containing protein n=2 Tax=Paenibacillus antri TaxID=2582848 RepID=A0A5R9GFC4_9BACL|nr:winged helix DNA-binding domain-containing protein [Paenibacillus antri]